MDLPANVLPILVIILCIFLAVALVGLTYCLNYYCCVTKKKKNEVPEVSRVEKTENHANEIEMIHKAELPKVTYNERKDGYMDPNCLKEFNTWLNPER